VPPAGTLSRRIDPVAVGPVWRAVEAGIRGTGGPAPVAVIGGKPLPVGGCPEDPGAAYGRAAAWPDRAVPGAWGATAVSGCGKAAGGRSAGRMAGGGYLPGDGNYDAGGLPDAASAAGSRPVAPGRAAKNPGRGEHYRSPHRSRELPATRSGRDVYRRRPDVARGFAHLGGSAGGPRPLPCGVRGGRRVRTWVWAELLINGVRILRKQRRVA